MDSLIQRIASALGAGATLEQVHDAVIKSGVSEQSFFLAFKAAELLVKFGAEHEMQMMKRPPPFGRKP